MDFSFAPPPKLERLTPETLASVSDDVIESALVSYVVDLAPDQVDEPSALDRLPPALRAWYVAFVIDAEVLNGGFNQFFFNSSRILAPEARDAFVRIGIPEAGELVDRALALLASHEPALEKAQEDGTIDAFMETYLDQPFEELDQQYNEQQERFAEARIRFIRDNARDFTHP